MNALGTHLLLDLKECNPQLLDNIDYIKEAMVRAAVEAGATVLGVSFHKFHPVGVTGVVVISESHICIHTWPEHRFAAVDIFTCGAAFAPRKAADTIIERLEAADPTITEVLRGFLPELASARA